MSVRVTDEQRRARLVDRHRLGRSAGSVGEMVHGVLALHSSDPLSPYLAAWARVGGFQSADLERALYRDRELWRLHAMRRTLFVVPRTSAAMFDGAVGKKVATRERERLRSWMAADLTDRTVRRRLAALEEAVLAELSDGRPRRTTDLSREIPGLQVEITVGSGKGAARVPLSSRLLYVLAMELKVVRAEPAGTWRSSQYHWVATEAWFDEPVEILDSEVARNLLLEHYLTSFGPATAIDIRWWTGWGAKEAASILTAVGAEQVELDGGGTGWVVAGDIDFSAEAPPSVTLLPGLDSTPMGWKERSWFLGDHQGPLFDRNGNIGPTVWVGGRIVGGWGQRSDGVVVTRLLEPIGQPAAAAVNERAAELTAWLDGTVVAPRFPTPLQTELGAG